MSFDCSALTTSASIWLSQPAAVGQAQTATPISITPNRAATTSAAIHRFLRPAGPAAGRPGPDAAPGPDGPPGPPAGGTGAGATPGTEEPSRGGGGVGCSL